MKGIIYRCTSRAPLSHTATAENNLFLVKRLIQRTDMRNPDTASKRYTSLAWVAVLGHEETFEFLLADGHDDDELSKVCMLRSRTRYSPPCLYWVPKDSENNTILMLLADQKPAQSTSYIEGDDRSGAYLRMAQLYYERYNWVLDWSNIHGKTALHIAALKGNEELVRVCVYYLWVEDIVSNHFDRCCATSEQTLIFRITREIHRSTSTSDFINIYFGGSYFAKRQLLGTHTSQSIMYEMIKYPNNACRRPYNC